MYYNVPIWGFVLGTVLFSIIFTWIYNNTRKGILAVLLLHRTGNLSYFIFPLNTTKIGGTILTHIKYNSGDTHSNNMGT